MLCVEVIDRTLKFLYLSVKTQFSLGLKTDFFFMLVAFISLNPTFKYGVFGLIFCFFESSQSKRVLLHRMFHS